VVYRVVVDVPLPPTAIGLRGNLNRGGALVALGWVLAESWFAFSLRVRAGFYKRLVLWSRPRRLRLRDVYHHPI